MTPNLMNCITFDEPGPPAVLRLTQTEVPHPGRDELLIRVLAAGVNRPDVFQRKGFYPPPSDASPILGLEVAGEVVDAGPGVPRGVIGRKICALTNGGGYAEFVTAPSGQCLRWPDRLSAIEAAALPETSFTVWYNLFQLGKLDGGMTVLVHGGTSGIGTTAIQYATALGARVFVTAGTDPKCEACLRLGAAAAINYRSQDFAEEVMRLTDGRGVDVILDMIGARYLERNFACLADQGRLVFIAFLGGAIAEKVNLGLIQQKRLTVTGSTLRPRTAAEKATIANGVRRILWPLVDAGLAKPVIHASFALGDAAAAHTAMEQGDHIGKIVLKVADV